jgi:hypothetical protein
MAGIVGEERRGQRMVSKRGKKAMKRARKKQQRPRKAQKVETKRALRALS